MSDAAALRALGRAARTSERRQALAFVALMAVTGASTVKGYVAAYPTAASRIRLATSLAGNAGFQALYGVPRHVDTVGGFATWRLAWMLAALTAVWGLLGATRLVRGEEESGRRELLLAGPTTPAQALLVDVATVFGAMVLFIIVFAAATAALGLPARGAATLSVAIGVPGMLFGALGAFTSQIYGDRRRALAVGGGAIGAAFLLRVAADGSSALAWMRWVTPFGWVENIRPFGGTDLLPLVLLLLATALFVAGSFVALRHRDFGEGLRAVRVREHPQSALLRNVAGFTVRLERGAVAGWAFGIGAFAFVFGLLSEDTARFARSQNFSQLLHRLGVANIFTAQNVLGFLFTFFALPIAIFAATQLNAARTEEASGRLDVLLVLPLSRRRWLSTRLVGTFTSTVVVALIAGLAAWLGAALRHAGVSLGPMLHAALNTIPATVLLVGLSVLTFALVPRLTAAVSLGSAIVAYLVVLVGELVDLPHWALDISPFHHVAPVPAAASNTTAAVVMTLLGLGLTATAVEIFARRDLVGA